MPIGKVKWFNNEKKYGFLIVDKREVFVHFSAILKEGYKTLKAGQVVECEVVKTPKGEMATNVKILQHSKMPKGSNDKKTFFLHPTLLNPEMLPQVRDYLTSE